MSSAASSPFDGEPGTSSAAGGSWGNSGGTSAAQDRETALYEALLYISEFPNRCLDADPQTVSLAEYAREALNEYEASRV